MDPFCISHYLEINMTIYIATLRTVMLSAALLTAACSSSDDDDSSGVTGGESEGIDDTAPTVTTDFDFFLTSAGPGDGANLGGLAGADVHCANLASAAGSEDREWRAFLSTTGADGVNAIDRIGEGPWTNANGVVVAQSTENLISDANNLNQETAISELGVVINGRGDTPNRHDILTGTNLDGTASTDVADSTCGNWTSNATGSAFVGHHDREGGGANPMSWINAHGTAGCSQADLQSTGGDGLFYCFAIN